MEIFLAALTANALVLGALTYLLRTLIGQQLQKDLLEFKNTIERKAAEEIEQFRAALEKDRLRLQISYGGIFERQADAILELYSAIVVLEQSANEAIHLGGDHNERRRKLEGPLLEVRRTIIDRQILLPPEVDTAIDDFLAKLPRAVRAYISADTRDLTRMTPGEMEKVFDQQERAMEIIEDEIPELRGRLVAEMRKVIGVAVNAL